MLGDDRLTLDCLRDRLSDRISVFLRNKIGEHFSLNQAHLKFVNGTLREAITATSDQSCLKFIP